MAANPHSGIFPLHTKNPGRPLLSQMTHEPAPARSPSPPEAGEAIRTEGLTKVYRRLFGFGRVLAVENLDLAVPRGRTFGFLGPNGAGKTTTIKMLLGLVRPTSGGGWLFGEPIGSKAGRAQVGFLPEDPSFAKHLRAREFLRFCSRLSHLSAEQCRTRPDEVLEIVGLADVAHRRLGTFSRGMLERIGIAQALLHEPALLILDEPMTGLDPAGRREVKGLIQRLAAEGKTLFFSSHILSDVEELCDRVGILNRGRLIKTGSLDELLGIEGAEVTIPALPGTLLERVEPLVEHMEHGENGWRLRAAGAASLKQLEHLLREAGCTNYERTPLRQNLETLFMETVEADPKE